MLSDDGGPGDIPQRVGANGAVPCGEAEHPGQDGLAHLRGRGAAIGADGLEEPVEGIDDGFPDRQLTGARQNVGVEELPIPFAVVDSPAKVFKFGPPNPGKHVKLHLGSDLTFPFPRHKTLELRDCRCHV